MAKIDRVQEVSTELLKPYGNNAKIHGKDQVEKIADSIKAFGFLNPCLIDKDFNVIAGHGRLLAAQSLGMKEIPCIYIEGLTEAERKAYILADNRLGELAEWNMDLVYSELADLDDDGFDVDLTGFDFDLDDDVGEVIEDDYDADTQVTPTAKEGDLWQLGQHRLLCGDSTDSMMVNLLMGADKADMILSDPPYGMNLDTDFSTIKGSLKLIGRKNHTEGNKYERVIGDCDDFSPELINSFFDNFGYCKEMFLFGADYYAEFLPCKNDGSWLVWDKRKPSQADAIGSEFEMIWSRTKHKRRMLRHDWFGFLSSENGLDARNRVHPTQKPITLLVDILNQWGINSKNIVDLYGGSGSTLIACEQTNRRCFMMELDPHYCDVIIDRWEQFTGNKAVLLKDARS